MKNLEENKRINKKIMKFFAPIFVVLFIVIIISFITDKEKPKTKAEIEQIKKDSIQAYRETKINSGLIQLEIQIQNNMKNPDSFDIISKDYDHQDTLDIVNMYIKFRGDNSFGGKTISRVDAIFNVKTEVLVITGESVE
jgi:hypothetical protein